MASYFHGNTSDIQSSAEGLQTLYLMNPNYVPYSDAPQQPTPNMFLVSPNTTNSATTTPPNALNLINFSHAPPPPSPNNHHHHYQHQHLIGVTIPASNILGSTTTDDPTRPSFLGQHEISGFHGFAAAATTAADATVAPRAHYNLWRSMIDQTASSAVTTSPSGNSGGAASAIAAADVSPRIGFHRPSYQQGLSLSLSSQQQTAYRSLSGDVDFQAISPAGRGGGGGGGDIHSFILGSKYLKALQELLDEVVNVGKGIYKGESLEGAKKEKMKANIESTSMIGEGSNGGVGENSGGNKQGTELTTALRQDLQMKKSKLVSMLDEVEQRYRQYHQQMQIVISSFEKVAGFGAAKSYVALALKTISKQFRCLKDAISSQIRTASKTLGEDDCLGVKVEGSRLRYVDHHLRQQRTLQQLGMVQHNAWRPQRGLPERAVSILRAWLFEHFLHPYPKDSDKVMLAKQTGLTRSQVSNWFINARVRLWKPMVEEMYLEETKEQEQNNGSHDNKNKSKESSKELWSAANVAQESGAIMRPDQFNILQSSKAESFNNLNTSPTEISNSNSLSTSPIGGGSLQSQSFFHLAGSSDMQRSPKKPKSSEMQNSPGSILSVDMEMKSETNRERHNKDGYPLMAGNENHVGGYGAFSLEEDIGRFNVTEHLAPRFHGNGVSLTLGLPHSENLTLSGTQHGFLSQNIHLGTNENEFCAINTPPSSHSGTSYESIDIQNRKRFSAQLLRDFVA